jgi:serine/threonine-protein kinase HipA
MARDREAVVWTRCGAGPLKMGRLTVTDTQCRFSYEEDYLGRGLPGLGILYDPSLVGTTTLVWERTPYFDLLPPLQFLVPPVGEANFQRRLILSYLEQQGQNPAPGFDQDWAVLMVAGHGGIGHLDVFESDEKAVAWYAEAGPPPLFPITQGFGFSLKEFLTWMEEDAGLLLETLGPTPSVGGAIPKLLVSIPDSGWDGRIGLPRKGSVAGRTDVILKLEKETYPGLVELEALALTVHAEAGFDVPRFWTSEINAVPAIAIERYDRRSDGRTVFVETVYSVMAAGDRSITHHYSSDYDAIGSAIDRSPIPIVDEPFEAKVHLMRRLLFALLTGNGDLHMENLSFVRLEGSTRFSRVYDPTPMRAYGRHNLLAVMPFGNYGEVVSGDQPVGLEAALERLAKHYGISRSRFRDLLEEALTATRNYGERVQSLTALPQSNKDRLKQVTGDLHRRLSGLLAE